MFSDVLKITPKIEPNDLAAMERSLSTRFTKIAKKFGGGLMDVLKGGGLIGIATTLLDKILNPLKEIQATIEKTLKTGDDLATYSKQFSTSPGKLARLQAFGQATGFDSEGVRMLLGKFQGAVATAAANPTQPSAVRQFIGKKDTAESFFEFIQSMQKMTEVQKSLVQQEVFGERQILAASSFLNADFPKLSKQIGGPSDKDLTAAAAKAAELKSMQDIMSASLQLNEFKNNANKIGPSNILQGAITERVQSARATKQLSSYDHLANISRSIDKLTDLAQDAYVKLAPTLAKIVPAIVDNIAGAAGAVEKSRVIRGMIPGQGKDN
jgi:hypothetical protein